MTTSKVNEYQRMVAQMLWGLYKDAGVRTEWPSSFGATRYSPRVDIAIGPFAVVPGEQFTEKYDNLMISSRTFIDEIVSYHLSNVGDSFAPAASNLIEQLQNRNRNARCFIAIEIENKVSRKHLMGSAINAAALGRIGLVVAWTPDKLKAFVKLRKYLEYLASLDKNTFDMSNLLILDAAQLKQAILDASGASRTSI